MACWCSGDAKESLLFGSAPKVGPSPFAPLPWDNFFDSLEFIDDKIPLYVAGSKGVIFFCLHGAGHSGLAFASLAKELKAESRVISFDFRGHGCSQQLHIGLSRVAEDNDYSIATLILESLTVLHHVATKFPNTSIVIIGHSMGGAVAAKAVKKAFEEKSAYPWCDVIKGKGLVKA